MDNHNLDAFQDEILHEFFRHKNSFYLSGGAALVGYYFGHRETKDLDLFTLEDEMATGASILAEVARKIEASLEPIQTSPDFRRFLITRGDDSVVVDLIREYTFQIDEEKRLVEGIRIDTAEEIFANKLCALLSRSEIRDLVDVYRLESAGYSLEDALKAAEKKDSGLSPGQLAWVLESISIGESTNIPGDASVRDLRNYQKELIERLALLALPKPK